MQQELEGLVEQVFILRNARGCGIGGILGRYLSLLGDVIWCDLLQKKYDRDVL